MDLGEIFRSRHFISELWQQIQILMIEAVDNFPLTATIQIDQVADHPGLRIDLPAHRDFDRVVMAVPVGVIALPIHRLVLFIGERVAVQSVRGCDQVSPGEMRLHASP